MSQLKNEKDIILSLVTVKSPIENEMNLMLSNIQSCMNECNIK